jgi:hypothetical protein
MKKTKNRSPKNVILHNNPATAHYNQISTIITSTAALAIYCPSLPHTTLLDH